MKTNKTLEQARLELEKHRARSVVCCDCLCWMFESLLNEADRLHAEVARLEHPDYGYCTYCATRHKDVDEEPCKSCYAEWEKTGRSPGWMPMPKSQEGAE